MGYTPLPAITESLDQLEDRLRLERNPQRKQRLHLLVLLKSQQVRSRQQAARHLALHRNTVAHWLGLYRDGGLERLLSIGQPGKPPGQRTLPVEALAALEARLEDPVGFASYVDVQQWLFDEFGLRVPYKSVYNLVRYHLGAKLKVPRPVHPKKA